MKLYLTRGFNGEPVHCFGEFDDENTAYETIDEFKDDMKRTSQYKIEPFNTINHMEKCDIIDFGDYSYFLRLEW